MSDEEKIPNPRSSLRLFRTAPHPCSYLADEEASTVFVDPEIIPSTALLSELSDLGFRRSGPHVYRPDCGSCTACVSVRVPVEDFTLGRRFRRVAARNIDLQSRPIASVGDNPEVLRLYENYINTRHSDGDMYPASKEQFESFILSPSTSTQIIGFYRGEKLLAVTVCDILLQGLSAVYTFFDPEEHRRSLGTYSILWLIERARKAQLPYVYLGYWVKDCRKMEYKLDFSPLELLQEKRWVRVN